jgi:hypothetical protein
MSALSDWHILFFMSSLHRGTLKLGNLGGALTITDEERLTGTDQ